MSLVPLAMPLEPANAFSPAFWRGVGGAQLVMSRSTRVSPPMVRSIVSRGGIINTPTHISRGFSTSSTFLGIVIWPSDNPMKSLILKRSERGLSVVRGYSPGYRGSSKALSIASGGVQGSKLGFFQPLRRQDLAKLRVPGVRMRGSRRCPGKQVPCLTLADRS